MLIILVTWICITLIMYPLGVLMHTMLGRMFNTVSVPVHFSLYCISGLMFASFFSSLLCLFIPLSLLANILLTGTAVAAFIFNRAEMQVAMAEHIRQFRRGRWLTHLLVFSFVPVFLFISYLPSSHYDDGLYYSTSIKWLQEYGTVKGLANLSPRIGYNSSWHMLEAIFGFRFLKAGLFNDLNGLLIVWLLMYSAGAMNNLKRGDNSVTNCIRALLILPALLYHFSASSDIMLFNINLVSSSSADIPACLITWLIFTLFLQPVNCKTLQLSDLLLVLYCSWSLSIKLSTVPVILLCVYIVLRLLIRGSVRQSLQLAGLCVILLAPWLTRNIYLSGYLLFPFSSIDLFSVPWKLPIADVQWNENAVRAFAIGADLDRPFELSFKQWFPGWFMRANFIQQVSVGTVLVATSSYLLIILRQILGRNIIFFRKNERTIYCVGTCFAGFLFWLLKAPDFRFGYGFIYFYCLLFLIVICRYFLEDSLHYLYLPVILFLAAIVIFYYSDRWMSARLLFGKPLPFRMPENVKALPLSNTVHVNIVAHEDSWNAPLPVANEQEFNMMRPSLLGSSIKEGFRSNKKGN